MPQQPVTAAVKLLIKAIRNLNIPYTFVDIDKTFMKLSFPKRDHFILYNTLGIISSSDERIAKDKAYQYALLKNTIRMPKTVHYLDPDWQYASISPFKSKREIQVNISKRFSFPLIMKKNQGSRGQHVFKVNYPRNIKATIAKIFNQREAAYDHLLLVQEYIKPKIEFRVVVYRKKIYLAYIKDIEHATYLNNLSPLHWENSRAIKATASQRKKLSHFIQPLFKTWPIVYAGLDIIEDAQGGLWLIEVNSAPGTSYYVRDNGESDVINMYQTIFDDLKKAYT